MMTPRRRPDIRPGELADAEAVAGESTVRQFEEAFAAYTRRKHAIAVGSGREGMALVLESLGLAPGREVIVPGYTLKELLPLIRSLGLVPVCADIDPHTINVTEETIARRITERTGAVLATHLFGSPCPIIQIVELAEKHGIKVIEDCAHSAGAEVNSCPTGMFGHAAFFSFETIKPINTYGGGMVVTDSDDLAAFLRTRIERVQGVTDITARVRSASVERMLFRSGLAAIPLHALAAESTRRMVASLYRVFQHAPHQPRRFSAVQAALGLRKLGDLHARRDRRAELAARLQAALPRGVQLQKVLPGVRPSWYCTVGLVTAGVSAIRKSLLWKGFDAGIRSEIADYCAGHDDDEVCPHSLDVYDRAILLPLHEGMTDRRIDELAAALGPRPAKRDAHVRRTR